MHTASSSQTQYVGGGAFFTNSYEDTLYSMAGFADDSTNGLNSLNAYHIGNDSWSVVFPGDQALNKLNRYQAMYATTESSGLGLNFIAGGMDWVPGMVQFNASNGKNPSWSNVTKDVPYFWGPSTEYVRFGNQGVLVSIGGYTSLNNTVQRGMSLIQVYDIDSQQWFEVTATGDIPRTRSSFCSGLSSALDDSSFQMTVYGGYNGDFGGAQGDGVIDDVYVLTMPAFQWIQVSNGTSSPVNAINSRRHLCHAYQDRQMIVLGGDFTDASENVVAGCNPDYPAIRLLDLSTYDWQTQYPLSNSTYEVPAQVYKVIGGGPNGGATLQTPAGGFNATIGNSAASSIFAKRVLRSKATLAQKEELQSVKKNSTNPATPTPPSIAVPASHSADLTAALVGAIVGGIALILGLSAAFLLFRRREMVKNQSEKGLTWQKAELPDQPPSPTWAEKRPGGFRTHEMSGDDPEALKPTELCGDWEISTPHKLQDSAPHRNKSDVSNSFSSNTRKKLPPLPVELPADIDDR